jgi:hypothetical protein
MSHQLVAELLRYDTAAVAALVGLGMVAYVSLNRPKHVATVSGAGAVSNAGAGAALSPLRVFFVAFFLTYAVVSIVRCLPASAAARGVTPGTGGAGGAGVPSLDDVLKHVDPNPAPF